MSEQKPSMTSMTGEVVTAATRALSAMPGQFLALCLLNVMFICALFWYEARQADARVVMITRLVDACVPLLREQSRH